MLKRFEKGAEQFQDHEILEVLLFYVIPRNNTNPIAHELINAFGSLAAVFRASEKELMLVKGIGKKAAEFIRCVGQCYERIKPAPKNTPLYFNPKAFSDFLEGEYREKKSEVLELFCLNQHGRVIFRKEFTVDRRDAVNVDPKEISEILIVKKPHTVIAAHNHPFGTRNPSAQDDSFTKQLYILCYLNNVNLGDHLIVGRDGTYSYRAVGKLEKIKNSCSDIRPDGGSAT